ncbi:DUF2974 domain-containing protein [Terrisporobacter sp.]
MRNIIDYVENQFYPMTEKNFNSVDSLILSQVTNYFYDDLVGSFLNPKPSVYFKDLLKAEYFKKMFQSFITPKKNKQLLFSLAASPRFRDIQINYHVSKLDYDVQKQFSATTFIINNEFAYIGFRGTDNTLVGWKEDFNMAFINPIPSHIEGIKYVNTVSKLYSHKLFIGGHSKGGNIAVYSAMHCKNDIKSRIEKVYSHDGPGFRKEVIERDEFKSIKYKINKTIPYSSLIGILLTNHEHYYVVKSNGVGGIMQHDPFSWEVGENDFIYMDELSSKSKYVNKTLNNWLSQISDEKRKQFIDSLFEILNSTKSETITDIAINWKTNLPIILDTIKNMNPKEKALIIELFRELANLSIKGISKNDKNYIVISKNNGKDI